MFRTLFTRSPRSECITKTLKSQTRGFRMTIPRPTQYKRFSDQGRSGTQSKGSLDWRRWDPPSIFGIALIVGCGIYYVSHLEQVPETGRWRFMNVSLQAEAEIGETTSKGIKREFHDRILPPDHPMSMHVRKVASRILKHSNLGRLRGEMQSSKIVERLSGGTWATEDEYAATTQGTYGPEREWDVIVVHEMGIINASATPGLITVFTGILPVCQNEQGVAAVLAHEIGHIVARHTAEKISSRTVTFTIFFVLQLLGFDFFPGDTLWKYLFELPNSRAHELEADLIGLRLMSRACYNPKAAPELYERLGKSSGTRIEFFQTHPSSKRRTRQLKEALPEAYSILAGNPQCDALREYLERFEEHQISIKDDTSLEFS